MGFMKSVYFASDLFDTISIEQNLSGLISSLLRDHYKKQNRTIKDFSLSEIRAERERLNSLADSESLKALDEMEKEILETEAVKAQKEQEKRERRQESSKEWIKEFFAVDDIELDALAEMYELEREGYETLFDWGKAKGLTLKEGEIVQ